MDEYTVTASRADVEFRLNSTAFDAYLIVTDAAAPVIADLVDGIEPTHITMQKSNVGFVDFPEDTTIPAVEGFSTRDARLRVVVNTYGRGPASATPASVRHFWSHGMPRTTHISCRFTMA